MKPWAYYNEFDAEAADWIRNLIKEGLVPDGEVDTRSIRLVQPEDVRGFRHCHFFAGIAGWALAARLAGWERDGLSIWTGSAPCQPFSLAGQKLGSDDDRHLWPDFFRLIAACRPAVVVGEQVSGALGYDWFDGVALDLGRANYLCRAIDIPAASVDSPQIRQRLYWAGVRNDYLASRDGDGLREIGRDLGEGAGEALRASGADHHAAVLGGRDAEGAGGSLPLVDASGLGRGEGVAGAEVLGGRPAATGADGAERGAAALARPAGERGPEVGSGHDPVHEQRAQDGRGPEFASGSGADDGDRIGLHSSRGGEVGHHGDVADRPSELGGEQQPLGGPEGRTAAPRHDAGERHGGGALGHADRQRLEEQRGALAVRPELPRLERPNGSFYSDSRWIVCHDGKARRIPEPGVPMLVAGVSGRLAVLRSGEVVASEIDGEEVRWVSRVAAWKGFGNAINPILAAEVLRALRETLP